MGKGIRQNRFVTLGKELALKNGYVGNLVAMKFDLEKWVLRLDFLVKTFFKALFFFKPHTTNIQFRTGTNKENPTV